MKCKYKPTKRKAMYHYMGSYQRAIFFTAHGRRKIDCSARYFW